MTACDKDYTEKPHVYCIKSVHRCSRLKKSKSLLKVRSDEMTSKVLEPGENKEEGNER